MKKEHKSELENLRKEETDLKELQIKCLQK